MGGTAAVYEDFGHGLSRTVSTCNFTVWLPALGSDRAGGHPTTRARGRVERCRDEMIR